MTTEATPGALGSNEGLGATVDALAVWRRLHALTVAAAGALNAWDSTVLPKSHDGMMQENMERLRDAMSA